MQGRDKDDSMRVRYACVHSPLGDMVQLNCSRMGGPKQVVYAFRLRPLTRSRLPRCKSQ